MRRGTWIMATLGAALAALWLWRTTGRGHAAVTVPAGYPSTDGEPWRGRDDLLLDPRCGHRPRPLAIRRFTVAPLADPTATVESVECRTSRLGLQRPDDLPPSIPGPRVLLLGDDHVMGAVPPLDNAGWLVERALRATPRHADARVLNAACDGYGPFHHVLVADELGAVLLPQVVVVVWSLGDDLVRLGDRSVPHLDDVLRPTPADPAASPPPDDPAARLARQAGLLAGGDARLAALRRKAEHCVRILHDTARRLGAQLLVVLLPAADLVVPDRLMRSHPALAQLGATLDRHGEMIELLQGLGIAFVDPLPELTARRDDADLFVADLRIGRSGHRGLADALTARLLRIL
jgi:hypothetical protein